MSFKSLVIGVAAVGLMAIANAASATPVASLGAVVAKSDSVTPAHYSKFKHKHEGNRIVYFHNKSGEKMTMGRSTSKAKMHEKKTQPPAGKSQQPAGQQPSGQSM